MTVLDSATVDVAAEVHPFALALQRELSAGSVVRTDESLARHTTLRVGGRADLWVEPGSPADLARVLQRAHQASLPVMIMGRGSNLLVRDGGVRGVVVHLGQPGFSNVAVEGQQVRCGAGARLKTVAIEARRHGLAGLEFLEGIPGSVGGALRMNAGAHGGATCDALVEVCLMDLAGQQQTLPASELHAEYRSCALLRDQVAIEAVFRGVPGDVAAIEQRMKAFNDRRWSSQPAAPSAGCVFKNPPEIPAGRLVDELGLKGTSIGGARVSLEHGNFIVTEGQATATDVLALIALIQERAREERGVELETEVQIVGEDPRA